MKNQTFVPAVAKFPNDLLGSWQIQQPLVDAGYRRGLMLVILGGIKGVTGEAAALQLANLEAMKEEYGNNPVVVMLSNTPLEEMDWLHNTEFAAYHVRAGIRFASQLPIGGRKIVTFHLNSLVTEDEFLAKSEREWRLGVFYRTIAQTLAETARYAKGFNVELKVETVPVPEYGDWSESLDLFYRGVHARHLRNPFYLTAHWGIHHLKNLGLDVCLDVCHNRTLYRETTKGNGLGIIFKEDHTYLTLNSLMTDVQYLEPSDLVHLNDGLGDFTREGGVFQEGVWLGNGDIGNLNQIIVHLNRNQIPFVIEVDEHGDFKNRPGTKHAINYLLRHP